MNTSGGGFGCPSGVPRERGMFVSDDDRLFDLFTDRFDRIETKVDNLADVTARLNGVEEDVREIKNDLKGRGPRRAEYIMALCCVISALVTVSTHWR